MNVMSVHYMHACCLLRPEESVRSLEQGLDGFELLSGSWKVYSGPSQEQLVLLTTGPALQPLSLYSYR